MTDAFESGKALAKQGDFDSALPLLEQAARETPDSPDVWLALAACYFRLDRNDDFRIAVRKSLSIDPEHRPTRLFLKRATGAETIPAADTGREKIYMEEGGFSEPKILESSKKPSGCAIPMALACLAWGIWLVFLLRSVPF